MRAVTVPTLVVRGDKDPINPLDRAARPGAGPIPSAALTIYGEGPRDLIISHRERLAWGIQTFAHGWMPTLTGRSRSSRQRRRP